MIYARYGDQRLPISRNSIYVQCASCGREHKIGAVQGYDLCHLDRLHIACDCGGTTSTPYTLAPSGDHVPITATVYCRCKKCGSDIPVALWYALMTDQDTTEREDICDTCYEHIRTTGMFWEGVHRNAAT